MKDKAKKILILGSVIIVTIIITISVVIIINSKRNKVEEKAKNISDYTIHDVLPEENNKDTENAVIVELKEDEKETNKISTENVDDVTIKKEIEVSKNNDVVKNKYQTKQEQSSNTSDKKVTETKNDNNKSENSSETKKEDISKPIENTNTESNTNTDKKEENNTETKVVETFKYNDKMAKQIKLIIEVNESEYMKKYGYNVTIDETIVNLTNQFTFTEDRVIDSLKYKFNTIKVYARDCYVNGTYMWTECFII